MNVADKLQQLAEMHRRGELTDAEFTQAKQSTLNAPPETSFPQIPTNLGETVREGVDAWIKYRVIMAVVSAVIFIIMAMIMFGGFRSNASNMPGSFGPMRTIELHPHP